MRFVAILSLTLLAADPAPDPAAKSLETAYQAAAQKADAEAARLKKGAADKRLKGYRDLLKKHTQAGDFDKATAVKKRIDELELEDPGDKASAIPEGAATFHGHHYWVSPTGMDWHQARKKCQLMGGHLVVIDTVEEMDFVMKQADGRSVWVGATDERSEGNWKWVNGKGMDVQKLKRVRLDNAKSKQHFLMLERGEGFDDNYVEASLQFICEWDK